MSKEKEEKAFNTMDLLEEHGIFEDRHAIDIAKVLEAKGFIIDIKAREELVKWIDEETVKLSEDDYDFFMKELNNYKNFAFLKIDIEDWRELRKKEDDFPDDLDLEEQPEVNMELMTLRTILDNLHEVNILEDSSEIIYQFKGIWDESHVGVLIAQKHWEKIMVITKNVFPDKTQEELVSDCDFVRKFLLKIREINGKVIEGELKELIGESPINMDRMLDYLKLY